MVNQLRTLADQLDMEAENVIPWGLYNEVEFYACECLGMDLSAFDVFSDFVWGLKTILGCLGATEIENYKWHQQIAPVMFNPRSSPYFRPGKLGESEGVNDIKDLKGIISIGFNDLRGYRYYEEPYLAAFYNKGLYKKSSIFRPTEWRLALGEFFNLSGLESEPESEVDYQ